MASHMNARMLTAVSEEQPLTDSPNYILSYDTSTEMKRGKE